MTRNVPIRAVALCAGLVAAAAGGAVDAAEPLPPPESRSDAAPHPAEGAEVRVVSVTVLAETGFRELDDWSRFARRGIERAARDLETRAGLRFEVAEIVPWDPGPSLHTLPAVLETVMRTTEPRNGITVIIVGDDFYKQLTEPGVSLTFRGRPFTVLVALRSFRSRLGRSYTDHLAWLFRRELGHVFGVPDMPLAGIMDPDPGEQTWEYDAESLAVIRAARTMDFSSPAPLTRCDLKALRAVYERLDDRGLLDASDLVNLGAAFYRKREEGPAAELFRRTLRRHAGSTTARLGLAQVLLAEGDSLGARRVLEAVPVDSLASSESGVAGALWGAFGEQARAESLLTAAVAADSTRFSLWFKRGLARFRRGAYADSRADFERALALEERPEGWFNLGLVCDAQGDGEAAAAAFRHYLALVPEGPQAEQATRFLERLARKQGNR